MKKNTEIIRDYKYYESLSNEYRTLMKLLNKDTNFINVFGFDRTLYTLEHYNSIDELNETLLLFIKDMELLGIELDFNAFNYSYYTLCYMEYFYKILKSEDFMSLMNNKYEEISKNCKNLNIHLKLCVRTLIMNNSKIIFKQLQHTINKKIYKLHIKKEDIYSKYSECMKKSNELKLKSDVHKRDYDINIKNIIEKLVPYKKYKENQELFLKKSTELLYILEERQIINKYSFIFSKYKDIKDNYVDTYPFKTNYKELNNLDKAKCILDNKIENIFNKINRCHDDTKMNDLIINLEYSNKELNDLINKINDIHNELYYLNFKHNIVVLGNTSIYNVIYFLSHNYYVLYDLLNKDYESLEEFRHIQYNPYLNIIRSINIDDYCEIDNYIKDKFANYFKIDIFDEHMIEYLKLIVNYYLTYEK